MTHNAVRRFLVEARRKILARMARVPLFSAWILGRIHVRRYRLKHGRLPDLVRPRLFTEYILHRMVHDRDPLLRIVSDKIAVRAWIDDVLGPGFTVHMLGAWEAADDVPLRRLPTPFVFKPSHASGPFEIVERPLGDSEAAALTQQARSWLASSYFDVSFEWGYQDVPRRLVAEPLLRSPDGGPLIEVTVFVFHGQPRILRALAGHKHSLAERCALWLDETGARSDFNVDELMVEDALGADGALRMQQQVEAARPRMLELCRRIGEHFGYIRVDLYITDAGLKIGELTPYPVGAMAIYRPDDADARLGAMLRDSGRERRDRGLPPHRWPPLD